MLLVVEAVLVLAVVGAIATAAFGSMQRSSLEM